MRWPRAVEERFVALPRPRNDGRESRKYFIVCGDDPLAHRLVDELTTRYDADVTVVLRARDRNHGPQISRIRGIGIVEAEHLDVAAFKAARLYAADALAIVHQNDIGNIDAALIAQEMKPGLRLVLRVFNTSLGYRVRRQLTDCTVLSDAAMAAPAFVSAALGELEVNHVRLPGRTLYVAHRTEVLPHQIMCGLATSSPATDSPERSTEMRPEVLPEDDSRADLVLAVADGVGPRSLAWPAEAGANGGPTVRKRYQLRVPALREALRALVDRKLWLAAAALVVVIISGSLILAPATSLSAWEAIYVTLLTAVGGAGPDPEHTEPVEQVIQLVITLAGIAMVPVITAAVVEAVLNARLAVALGRLRAPVSGHVVVVGLGNVGTRVIRGLHEFGIPVVAIDRVNTARGADLAKRLHIPLVIGDASQEETLRSASIQTSRALVVMSTDDNVNLEAALNARELKPDIRVVMRLFDGDFARRVQRAFGVSISHSVSYVAAPAFAAAMMEREVLTSIPVGRRVLLIAEIPVCEGSELDGGTVSAVDKPGALRVLAVHRQDNLRPQWTPAKGTALRASDRLIVVATRAGLAEVMERTVTPPPVPLE